MAADDLALWSGWLDEQDAAILLGLDDGAEFGGLEPITFPATNLRVRVELLLGGAWVDVTQFVRYDNRIVISRGRRAGQRRTSPATCALTLDNVGEQFTPRNINGPYFGQLRKQTPLRVWVNPGDGDHLRFTGRVPAWPPLIPDHPNSRRVSIVAAGRRQRLERGNAPVLKSAPRRFAATVSPLHFWSLEDATFANAVGTPDAGVTRLIPWAGTHPSGAVVSLPEWGSGTLAPWLPPVVSASGGTGQGTVLWAPVAMSPTVTTWTVDFIYRCDATVGAGTVDGIGLAVDFNPSYLGGAAGWPQVTFLPASSIIRTSVNGPDNDSNSIPWAFDGYPHHFRFTMTQAGSLLTWEALVDGTDVTGGGATATMPVLQQVGFNAASGSGRLAFGEVAVYGDAQADIAAAIDAAFGHRGESAVDRFLRLCLEEGIPAVALETLPDAELMGPQGAEPLMALLRQCESVNEGLLDEDVEDRLRLISQTAWWNQALAMRIDCAASTVQAIEVSDDDEFARNDWTITRRNGATARSALSDGPNNVAEPEDDPDGIGQHPDAETLVLHTDDQAVYHAGSRVNRDSLDRPRIPRLGLNLARTPALIAAWLRSDIGALWRVANPPTELGAYDTDVILEGFDEVITHLTWDVVANLSPADLWSIGSLAGADGAGDAYVIRLEPDTAVLAADASAGASSLSITVDPVASTDPVDVDGLVLEISGLLIPVTAIGAGPAPQTFTVVGAAVTKALRSGARVVGHSSFLGL